MKKTICISGLYSDIQVGHNKSRDNLIKIRKIVSDCLSGKLLFNYSNQVMRAVPADALRILSQTHLLTDDDLSRSTLISTAYSCEKRCSGSGFVFLMLVSEIAEIDDRVKLRLTKGELSSVVKSYLGSGKISKLTERICHQHGFEYDIDFLQGYENDLVLRHTEASSLPGHIDPAFSKEDLSGHYFVFCTKGKIESVGEIDNLLQWAQEGKKNVILLAEYFSPDVANTLECNYGKALNVIPFVFDPNTVDPSSVCKQVVDIESGLRFSNLDYESFEAYDVNIKRDRATISSGMGDYSKLSVLLPGSLFPVKSIVEERIRAGVSLTKTALLKGVCKLRFGNSEFYAPVDCLEFAARAKNTYEDVMKADCVVSLS